MRIRGMILAIIGGLAVAGLTVCLFWLLDHYIL